MLYLGTSGFSYNDWVGEFYPRGLSRRDWLGYYAREFNALELNSTYYAIPKPSVLEAMIHKTGEGFLFSVKANQEMTHQRQQDNKVFTAFVNMLQPFINAGKLGCVLAQFPFSFGASRPNFYYLALFREWLKDIPLVVEFRNVQWLKPEVFDWLRKHNLGFCCVDEPQLPKLLPPLAEVTSDIGYVRFHGRNVAKWWQHQHAYERYDYTYSAEELREWLSRIGKLNSLAEKTFIFANNHWRGQSVSTIRQLRMMLD
jgi:uncharacterized protein YecE (DUF72 family)